ncbi:hypothetical protein [uncultured Anaerococcus sp.]|uniref:hypothetical protein n=1 Tax=uncultured Anaerococcus sp. TaxID=293428 RepID=UPI00288C1B11|nr:hypothetical protein [uncultured Anaerococcus sp.]
MQKKYGIDEYGIFLVWIAIVAVLVAYFIKSTVLNGISSFIVIYAIFRTMSTNILKRSQENQVFIENVIDPIKNVFNKDKFNQGKSRDDGFKYISCPTCGQKLRIPKNKGKIKVRCPKCKEKFDAKS